MAHIFFDTHRLEAAVRTGDLNLIQGMYLRHGRAILDHRTFKGNTLIEEALVKGGWDKRRIRETVELLCILGARVSPAEIETAAKISPEIAKLLAEAYAKQVSAASLSLFREAFRSLLPTEHHATLDVFELEPGRRAIVLEAIRRDQLGTV